MADDDSGLLDAIAKARDPRSWLAVGEELYASAVVLQNAHRLNLERLANLQREPSTPVEEIRMAVRDLGVGTSAFMLLGFAVESLLKGLLAVKDPNRLVKTHKLRILARDAVVDLTAGEDTVIDRLTMFVEWAGRYPVSARDAQFRPEMQHWGMGDLLVYEMCWRIRCRLVEAIEGSIN